MNIDEVLVARLVAAQFPQWNDLPISPVALSGWDNRTFHLGDNMLARLPSAAMYANQVEKEQKWLSILAPFLPLEIPTPLAMGNPTDEYPWYWSIYRWIDGESSITDLTLFAKDLAHFLSALHKIPTGGGPRPGPNNFYRGGDLAQYDEEMRKAIHVLNGKIDHKAVSEIWEKALASSWEKTPVWVHGDISAGNLLTKNGKLCAVIDFGQMAVGDPACDLMINWTLFKKESRKIFHEMLPFDEGTWTRARAWTLWKALVVAAGFTNPNNFESQNCNRIIKEVIENF